MALEPGNLRELVQQMECVEAIQPANSLLTRLSDQPLVAEMFRTSLRSRKKYSENL